MNAIYQNQKIPKGIWGETVAARYCEQHGYRVIARNVEFRDGEIDLVAVKGGVLFFIEVKTRADERFGTAEAVTPAKRHRLLRAAMRFVQMQGLTGAPSQFDCMVVLGRPGDSSVRVRHYRNI